MNAPSSVFEIIHETLRDPELTLSVTELCKLAGVSHSGYYNCVNSETKRTEKELADRKDFELIQKAYQYRGYQKGIRGIPNIIQHNGFGTELVSLYVIRYMLNNNYRGVYGDSFIEGTELLNNLVDLLCGLNSQISNRSKWSSLFGGAIAYLYNKGILFRSLYDIETEDPSMIKRQYDNSYKLYLSPRGEMLYNLLATNGVLMEIYRDDVATEIKNNDKISSELNATERFIYSLNMVEWLFGIEQSIAVQCFWNIKKYIDYIGKSFISTHILLGVASNIKLYYTENKTEQQDEVVEKIETIANKMKNYVDQINGLYGNSFTSEEIEAIQNIIEEVANQEKD